jgi:FtsP/CotA-like multicopper oxidase with cupredoxin domain
MKRRTFILGSITGAIASLLETASYTSLFAREITSSRGALAIEQALRFPSMFSGGDLIIGQSNLNIWTDKATSVLTFNGSYPGPTIKVKRGEFFSAKVINQLSVASVVHWHGLVVPEKMDGHPMDAISAGSSSEITFPIVQRAGTYFYHAHPDRATASQVYKGLAGFFIIEDDEERALGLPSGEFDVPLLIQDKRTNANRELLYAPSMMDSMGGYLGSDILINGTPDAYLNVNRTLYRFRLLNGSNARIYKVAFSDGTPFQVIGSDGGLIDKPATTTASFLSPGERLDILVDLSNHSIGNTIYLKSLPFTYSGMAGGGASQGTEMNLLKLSITGSLGSESLIPETLSSIKAYDPALAKRTRSFTLRMSGMSHTINNKTFSMNRIDETVNLNELEQWDFINSGDETHPMHVHGLSFQILERDGKIPSEANDRGWKDTIMVPGRSRVSVLVKFDTYAGLYLMHCHNLEHEDSGMMLNILVKQTSSINEVTNIASDIVIYPNPASSTTNISLSLTEASPLTLSLYSLLGENVMTIYNGYGSVGANSFTADVSKLVTGVYHLRIETTSGVLVRQIVVE